MTVQVCQDEERRLKGRRVDSAKPHVRLKSRCMNQLQEIAEVGYAKLDDSDNGISAVCLIP